MTKNAISLEYRYSKEFFKLKIYSGMKLAFFENIDPMKKKYIK